MKKRIRFNGRAICNWVLGILIISSCSENDNSPDNVIPINFDVKAATYGGSLNDNANSVVATSDGGYAVLGYTQSNDGDVLGKTTTDFDFWMLKFDSTSSLQWQKSYGGSGNDRGNALIQTSDGGYALLGFSESNDGDVTENAGAQDYWLAKTDGNGNLAWQKSFGFKGRDEGISLIQTNDSGFLLVGVLDVTASEGQGIVTAKNHAGGDYWAIKLSEDGVLQWSQYFGGTFTDTAYGVVELDGGGFLIAGSSDSFDVDISNNKGTYDFWVVRISDTGQLLWEKNYGGNEIDEPHSIIPTIDGNFLIVGDTRSADIDIASNNGAADVWAVKINPEGEIIWEIAYGGSGFDAGRGVEAIKDGGFLLVGSSRSGDKDVTENNGQNDAWLIKIDADGILEWEQSIGGSEIEVGYGVIELANGTIVAVGESASSDFDVSVNKGFTDVLIISVEK